MTASHSEPGFAERAFIVALDVAPCVFLACIALWLPPVALVVALLAPPEPAGAVYAVTLAVSFVFTCLAMAMPGKSPRSSTRMRPPRR